MKVFFIYINCLANDNANLFFKKDRKRIGNAYREFFVKDIKRQYDQKMAKGLEQVVHKSNLNGQ